jgi:hypothetical protein
MSIDENTGLSCFAALQPVALCGACGKKLYEHSTPNMCEYRDDCPLRGSDWARYKRALDMRGV